MVGMSPRKPSRSPLDQRIALRLTEDERDQLDQLTEVLASESSFDVGLNDAIRHALRRLFDEYRLVPRKRRPR